MPLSFILLAISQPRGLCASRRGRVGHGAGHRVLETFSIVEDRCRVGRSQCPLVVVPRHLRASSTLPQGVRPAQGPPLVSISRGVEFPGAQPHLRAVRSRRPTSVPSLDVTRI